MICKNINLDHLKEIIYIAGKEVLNIYNSDKFEEKIKDDNTPVTKADLVSHKIIFEFLTKNFPDIPVLSEESNKNFRLNKNQNVFWCIDPVDGTKEFIKKNNEFTINISLIENCLPTIGLIYAPALDDLYYAKKGYGAYWQKNKEIKTLNVKNFDKNDIKFAVSRSHLSDETIIFMKKFPNYSFKKIGSSLKLCSVASGLVDCYPRFGPTSFWDIAAGHIIITEAGGILIDNTFKDLKYNINNGCLNSSFFAANAIPINRFIND